MKENEKLLKIIHELVRRAYFCIFATNEERVISEGGLITASKTYLKSALIVLNEIERLDDEDVKKLEETMKMLRELYEKANQKSNKFDLTKDVVRKKINKVRWTAKWVINSIEKRIVR